MSMETLLERLDKIDVSLLPDDWDTWSLADRLASLPGNERDAALNDLTDDEWKELEDDWRFYARPSQIPPDTPWFCLLVCSGRGFGKNWLAAHWVNETARKGDRRFGLVVGPTWGSVVESQLEGPTGILTLASNDFMPAWHPSKKRLVWPNGVRAYVDGAEEPNRFRGPQYQWGWCLAGDTNVLMADGSEKFLRDVAVGDWVQTRAGPRVVTGSALTRRDAEIFELCTESGLALRGTADHPVWVDDRGFVPLGQITEGMTVCVTRVLSGAASGGTERPGRCTSSDPSCSTERSGRRQTGRSPRVMSFTTRTRTRPTTAWRTWSCLAGLPTAAIMALSTSDKPGRRHGPQRRRRWIAIGQSGSSGNCIVPSAGRCSTVRSYTPDASAPHPVSRRLVQPDRSQSIVSVSIAASLTPQPKARSGTARVNATTGHSHIARLHRSEILSALPAERRLPAADPMLASVQCPAPSVMADTVSGVGRLATTQDVYDIAVDGEREFFANGILVHNCDEVAAWKEPESLQQIRIGMRLPPRPQMLLTTTPRPVPHIVKLFKEAKEEPERFVIRTGSTYENMNNLSDEYYNDVIRPIEGSRLAKQELEGKLLLDTPGALWNQEQLDSLRVDAAPDLARVVVGVDPSVGGGDPDGDECGIIVVGIGYPEGESTVGLTLDQPPKPKEPHLYVLADLSGHMGPDEWTRVAVVAARKYKADCIVAEVNQGGDLVEKAIKTVDLSIRVKKVHATRGKYTRAEPIANFYSQGRAHHVGRTKQAVDGFDVLEDQMCTLMPGTTKSPDRADALVWGAWELMFHGGRQRRGIQQIPANFGGWFGR